MNLVLILNQNANRFERNTKLAHFTSDIKFMRKFNNLCDLTSEENFILNLQFGVLT